MKGKTKEKSEEFTRFEDLARKLVSVPKKDIRDQEKPRSRGAKDKKKRAQSTPVIPSPLKN